MRSFQIPLEKETGQSLRFRIIIKDEVRQRRRIVQSVWMVSEKVSADDPDSAAGLLKTFGKNINVALRQHGLILTVADGQDDSHKSPRFSTMAGI